MTGAHHISSDFPTRNSATSSGYYLSLMDNGNDLIACNPITTNSYLSFSVSCAATDVNSQYYAYKGAKWLILLSSMLGVLVLLLILSLIYHFWFKKNRKKDYEAIQETDSHTYCSCFRTVKKDYIQISYDATT